MALSDNAGFVEIFGEFLSFILNQNLDVSKTYQDNMSVISLVAMGGGKMRTKHMRT